MAEKLGVGMVCVGIIQAREAMQTRRPPD